MSDRVSAPGFRARLHLKDLGIVKKTAIELGLELPALDAVFRQMDALVDSGRGELDHSALVLLERGE